MRLIDADKLKCIYPQNKAMHEALNHARTINAIVIPKNATNGEVIKAMFPNDSMGFLVVNIGRNDWWNTPYKKGE